MFNRKIVVTACAAAMFASVGARPALAQGEPIDARTEFTFNAPVELPGVTLPPGSYVFRFVDATTGRKVMQVMDKGDNKTYGLFLTITAQRPKASDDAELRFLETPEGKPAAVKTWWYPGNTIGREFIYPKSQARRLAQRTNTTVLTTTADNVSSDQMKTADLSYVAPSGQETKVNENGQAVATSGNSQSMDRTPVQESTSASNMANSRRSMPNRAAQTPRSRLPRTNGLLPLFAMFGASSLAGGLGLRFRR